MAEFLMMRVTFRTQLHCTGCMAKMHKSLSKIKGVQDVSMDKRKDLVFVTGINLVPTEISYLMRKKHRKQMEIVCVEYGGLFGLPGDDIAGGTETEDIWGGRNGPEVVSSGIIRVCSSLATYMFMIIVLVVSLILFGDI